MDMRIVKNLTFNKTFVLINTLVLSLFIIRIVYKVFTNWNLISFEKPIHFYFIILFCFTVLATYILIEKIKLTSSVLKIFLVFSLIFLSLFSYDLIIPEEWADAKGDVITSQKVTEVGISRFLEEYHIQSLQEINKNQKALESFNKYSAMLPFMNYSNVVQNSLSKKYVEVEYNRTLHHPPTWFIILGLWQKVFGSSLISLKIISKLFPLFFLFLLYFFSYKHLKLNKHFSITLVLLISLTPRFLIECETPKSDLFFGIFVILLLIQLYRTIESHKIRPYFHFNDVILGVILALAILAKFTGLLLALPIIAAYLINFKYKGIPRLFIVLFSFIILPGLLYLIFDYDMLLNIITGRSKQDFYIYNQAKNVSVINFFINAILYGLYYVGIPIILFVLMRTALNLNKFLRKPLINELIFMIFYFSIFLLLWRSQVSRHQISFIIFLIPIVAVSLRSVKNWKPITNISLFFLFIYDLLFLINSYLKLSLQSTEGWIFNY
jgi:hypothetical protein